MLSRDKTFCPSPASPKDGSSKPGWQVQKKMNMPSNPDKKWLAY
jgi:hypothetical protein